MKASVKLALLIVAAILITVLTFLVGAGAGYNNGEYKEIYSVESLRANIVAFEDAGAKKIVALNDGNTVLLLLDARGSVIKEEKLSFHTVKAGYDGGCLYLYYENESKLSAVKVSCDDLSSETYDYDIRLDSLEYYTINSKGELFCSLADSPMELRKIVLNGVESFSLAEPLSFLECRNDDIYLHAEGELFVFENGNLQEFFSDTLDEVPFRFLDAGYIIGLDGMIYRISGKTASPIFKCSVAPSEYIYHSMGGNEIAYALNSDEISVADITTGVARTYQIDGSVEAVSADSAIVSRDSKLYITDYTSFREIPPEASDVPSEPGEDAGFPDVLDVEGDFAYIDAGMTVKKLKDLFTDEEIAVFNEGSSLVPSGYLKTGFTVKNKKIVILGDTNGTGTVNGSDIKEAQAMLLGLSESSSVYFKAADMNRDNEINTTDLVILAQGIS